MPVNVDLNGLYAFRALVEYGSFRSAAESICLSQSALSRRIEKLEAALGARLFDRTTRRVTLTLYGQTFAERSDRLLANFEEVMADVSQVSQERTGLVTVATVPSAAYYFMPEVIRRFQTKYPRVRVKLIDSSVGNVIEAVMNGQADFGICFSGHPLPNTEFLPLVEDAYVAACRRDSPLAVSNSLTWNEFYQQEYVGLDKVSGNRNLLDQALGEIIPARPSLCETRHEQRLIRQGGDPVVDLRLCRVASLWRGLLAVCLFMLYFSSFIFLLTNVLQRGLMLSPLLAGLVFVPSGLTFISSSLFFRRWAAAHQRLAILTGCGVSAVGLLLAAWGTLFVAAPVWFLLAAVVITGCGNGLILPVLIGFALRQVPSEQAGMGSALLSSAQQFASALGISAFGTLFYLLSASQGLVHVPCRPNRYPSATPAALMADAARGVFPPHPALHPVLFLCHSHLCLLSRR